jgi:hypothetical protein
MTGPTREAPTRTQQSYGTTKVNHVYTKKLKDTPGMVVGEFLVHSFLATVLIDSEASHSFISAYFVESHYIPIVALKKPLLTKSPGGHIPCHLGVINILINLSGVVFPKSFVVLNSCGIDVILGMDWLTKHRGTIAWAKRTITVTNHLRKTITCDIQSSLPDPSLHSLKVESPEQVPSVKEYPDVFLEELLGLPPDWDIEFAIDLVLETSLITNRPYRMTTPSWWNSRGNSVSCSRKDTWDLVHHHGYTSSVCGKEV